MKEDSRHVAVGIHMEAVYYMLDLSGCILMQERECSASRREYERTFHRLECRDGAQASQSGFMTLPSLH
jgi:hypothetical protein